MNRRMVMTEFLQLAPALLAGLGLGAMFFWGLWWTVRKSISVTHPALWWFVSLALRMGATVAGFYFVGGADGRRLVLCLAGFVLARIIVLRVTSRGAIPVRQPREVPRASES